MGEIFIPGFPYSITIEGTKPTKAEAQNILKIVERLDEVKMQGGNDLLNLADKFAEKGSELGSKLVEGTVTYTEKENAINILDDLNMLNKEELKPLEKIGLDRTTAGVAGSMFLSAGGYRDLYNQVKKNVKLGKIPTVANIVLSGGKAYFGGVFGDIGGRAALDIANAIISGDPKMLEFLKDGTLDADAKQAMWYESIGMAFPQLIGAGFKALTDLKDPAVKAALESAERLGIQINFGQIAKYADKVRAIGPLPYIGKGVRNSIKAQGKILNDTFRKFTELYTPVKTFSDAGVDIFARADSRFEAGKRILNSLWNKAYDSHAMLPNKNIFKGEGVNNFINKLVKGDVLRQFKGLPVNSEGIIKEYDTIIKEGFFDKTALSRIKGEGLKDLITTLRKYQLDLKQGKGNISYEQIRNYNEEISILFKDLTEGDKVFASPFKKLLSQFRGANDSLLTNESNLIKELIPEKMLSAILQSHKNAMNYTKGLKLLYERPSGSIFGKYVDNIFEPGILREKKEVDQLLESLMKIKSPAGLRDLRKIIGEKQFGAFADEYLTNIFKKSFTKGSESVLLGTKSNLLIFDPVTLNKNLGFDIRGKSEFMDELFKTLGISSQKLKDVIRTGAFIENVKIGDPSAFLQRRFQLTGAKDVFGTLLGAGAAYKGGEAVFSEDDGIFTKGIKGLVGLMAMKYSLGKVFANPKLAKNIIDIYELKPRTFSFKKKLDIMRSIFDFHHNEQPDEIVNTTTMFGELFEDISSTLNKKDLDDMSDLFNDLKTKSDIYFKINKLDAEDAEMEDMRNEIINPNEKVIIDEGATLNVPQPDANFNMAAVVEPLPGPSSDRQEPLQLDDVGLSLFNANQGGIASLCGDKKPQQMVA